MKDPVTNFWNTRLEQVREVLEEKNFQAFVVRDINEAKEMVLNKLLPEINAKTLSWGGSMTFITSGLYDALKDGPDYQVIDTYEKSISSEEKLERRRQALLVDVFFTGSNAITEDGMLVNLDMYGNRVAALTFGPKNVLVLAGRNKIIPNLEAAFARIKEYAAPVNAMRLEKKTPCIKTGQCEDCNSPDRICNYWTITEKSFPEGRIKVILINQDLGL